MSIIGPFQVFIFFPLKDIINISKLCSSVCRQGRKLLMNFLFIKFMECGSCQKHIFCAREYRHIDPVIKRERQFASVLSQYLLLFFLQKQTNRKTKQGIRVSWIIRQRLTNIFGNMVSVLPKLATYGLYQVCCYVSLCAKSNIIGGEQVYFGAWWMDCQLPLQSFIIQINEHCQNRFRSSLLGRPNKSIPTEIVSGHSSSSYLSVFTQYSDQTIDLHLCPTKTRHHNGSLADGVTVVSNLQPEPWLSLWVLPSSWPLFEVGIVLLSFCLPPFSITKSSSIPLAVDMRSLSVGPSGADKLFYLLPIYTAEQGKWI